MAIKSFNVLYLPAYSATFHDGLLYVVVPQQCLFSELFTPLLEDYHACVFLPDLEMLLFGVESKVVYVVKTVIDLLLFQVLLELHELSLIVEVLRQPSLRNDHVFIRVFFIELHYLPIIRTTPSVHITKFFGHLSVNSAY